MLPMFGFSSGCMRFEPASLLLWIDERRDALRPRIERLEALSREAKHSLFEPAFPGLATKVLRGESDDVRGLAARLRHETDHLRRHLGTSYGLFYHYLNSALPPYFFEWCRANLARNISLSFPLLNSSLRAKLRLGRIQDLKEVDMAALAWASTVDLMQLMDGNRGFTPQEVPMMQMLAILRELASAPGQSSRACDLNIEPFPKDTLLPPFISLAHPFAPQLLGETFGAKHLLEAIAFMSEGSFGLLSGGQSENWKDSVGLSDYSLITTFWQRFFGEGGAFLSDPGEVTFDDSRSDEMSYRIWPLELAAAIDLALWIPIGPHGLVSDSQSLRWEDVHPGWRFLKICSHLRSGGKPFVRIPRSLEQTDKIFRDLQLEWSSQLGWPSLDNLMMNWIEFLEATNEDGKYNGFFFETGKGHPRFLSSLAILARRFAFPYQVAMNYYDYSDVSVVWFPFILARDGEMAYQPKSDLWTKLEGGEIRRFAPYAVHHGSRLLVQGKESVAHIPARHNEMIQRLLVIHASLFHVPLEAFTDAVSEYLAA
jgi:hypothetical protein